MQLVWERLMLTTVKSVTVYVDIEKKTVEQVFVRPVLGASCAISHCIRKAFFPLLTLFSVSEARRQTKLKISFQVVFR